MILHARGTPGMGDAMMYLNVAHTKAHAHNGNVTLYIHWPWPEDYMYHFEDPEPIHERMDYIHNFYLDKNRVTVIHKFNSNDTFIDKYRLVTGTQLKNRRVKHNEGILNDKQNCTRTWLFDKHLDSTPIKKKIALWRPTFNREEPRKWKMVLDDSEWESCISKLEELGYSITEITYRTPIREALYHCRTAEMAFFYDGMWHIITTMLFKPTIVVGNTGIVLSNTFNGIPIRTPKEIFDLIDNWNIRRHWDRPKKNNKGEVVLLPRFNTPIEMTGREYIIYYNNRMKNKLLLMYSLKADWSRYPVMLEEHRNRKERDKNRQSSNRG